MSHCWSGRHQPKCVVTHSEYHPSYDTAVPYRCYSDITVRHNGSAFGWIPVWTFPAKSINLSVPINIPGTRYIGACNVKMNMILAEHRHTAVVAEMEIGILNWPEKIAIF